MVLLAFCEYYHLTACERVILKEVLRGKDNQNIASSLQLAMGTVKAHVHNILKKTGTTTRQELTQLFWKGRRTAADGRSRRGRRPHSHTDPQPLRARPSCGRAVPF